MRKIILITGGQRSGKSRYAEALALGLSPNPVYLATARVWDEEFRQRVTLHQQRRGPQWTNIEEEKLLSRHRLEGRVVVIDCITLWLTNFFFDAAHGAGETSVAAGAGESRQRDALPDTAAVLHEAQNEFDRFIAQDATFIFVTNEIGSGGVSDNALQRRFTDLEGWMNQYVASRADEVILMVSGIAVQIKPQR